MTSGAGCNFPNLLAPGRIGTLQVKNRVLMAPVSTNFATAEGEVTPELVSFYERRARGGAGLLILECVNVDFPRGKTGHTQMRIDSDRFVPKLHELAEILHEAGASAALQLNHSGGLYGDRSREALKPVAPSPFLYGKLMIEAEEASREEIHRIRNNFIDAAERAALAGFDAIEIHGAHGYLLAEFLSPWTNQRKDEYGGSVENRTRLALEIVQGIRKKLPCFPIIFRISGDEFVSPERGLPEDFAVLKAERPEERNLPGRGLAETVEVVNLLKSAGVDGFHVTAGTHRLPHTFARRAQVEGMGMEQGWKSYLAGEIRRACNVKTVAVGVIRDHAVAEEILSRGDADFVALGRGLIADPDWVSKARTGKPVRKCIGCNSCVQYRSGYGWKLRCAVNAMAGREYRLGEPETAGKTLSPRKVLVVGGGPAGMEAARVAALRGHRVTLAEKKPVLGGSLVAAGILEEKSKIRWLNEWLQGELAALNVELRPGFEVTEEALSGEEFDALVIATGGLPESKRLPAIHNPEEKDFFAQATELLEGTAAVPKGAEKVLVVGGGLIGCETACYIARKGFRTTVMTRRGKDSLGADMDPINRYETLSTLFKLGIEIRDGAKLVEISPEAVRYENGNGETLEEPFDFILFAQGMEPDRKISQKAEDRFPEVYRIGDCVMPRNILYAVYEGFSVGNKI
ncbi:MAG: NAD(P)/FAD-dependent oxidoreductase [Synergistales bacterium]